MGPEQALELGLGVPAEQLLPLAAAGLPPGLGPVPLHCDPTSAPSSWSSTGGSQPSLPHPAWPVWGPGMRNGTSRSLCSCTQHPVPTATHGARAPMGRGVSQGSGPPAGRSLAQQRWRQGCVQQLPPQHAASCPRTPSLPTATPSPAPARATVTGWATSLQPSYSIPQHP